jgi:hypothetical protein
MFCIYNISECSMYLCSVVAHRNCHDWYRGWLVHMAGWCIWPDARTHLGNGGRSNSNARVVARRARTPRFGPVTRQWLPPGNCGRGERICLTRATLKCSSCGGIRNDRIKITCEINDKWRRWRVFVEAAAADTVE